MFRDDKSYPWAAITWAEEFPRIFVGRGQPRKGVRYFGPYRAAWAIRQTVDVLLTAYPMRSCTSGVFRSARASGRPCLFGDIGKCAAPCVGRISADGHRELVAKVSEFLTGRVGGLLREAQQQMEASAAAFEYEQAAIWRDRLQALRVASEKNAIVFLDGTDADVVALAEDQLEVAVAIFFVRGGRVVGERGWVADRADDSDTPALLESFLLYHYAQAEAGLGGLDEAVPPLVLVPAEPESKEVLAELLSERRGSKVAIRVPRRGDKRTLLDTVAQNAASNLALHKTRRASDLTTRGVALEEIQEALGLPDAPLRIECFDISHTQGQEVVGSMVVFEDGLPKKSDYRRFTIKSFEGSNDVAAMHEVLTRRFAHQPEPEPEAGSQPQSGSNSESKTGPESGSSSGSELRPVSGSGFGQELSSAPQPESRVSQGLESSAEPKVGSVSEPRLKRFAYTPALIVVDGGAPQVAAAAQALSESGVTGVALCGLAKRLEEVWLPDEEYPVILPRNSEGLYLLQRVRDEAHRFAITHHRTRRSKSMLESQLDEIPGLGPTRIKALRRHFGSQKALRAATPAELAAVPDIGPKLAATIAAALQSQTPAPAIDTATGEIIE
jgi:excinuclease ABC subunit C